MIFYHRPYIFLSVFFLPVLAPTYNVNDRLKSSIVSFIQMAGAKDRPFIKKGFFDTCVNFGFA
jgi:hypothetical protein